MVCAAAVRPTSPSNLPQGRDSGPTNARKSALLDPFDQGRDLHPELPEGRMIVDRFSPRQGGQALVDLDAVLHRVPNAHRLARHGHLDRSFGVLKVPLNFPGPTCFSRQWRWRSASPWTSTFWSRISQPSLSILP